MDAISKAEKDGIRLSIFIDEDVESPREMDNIGTMACWHRNYDLGDEQPKEEPHNWIMGLLTEKQKKWAFRAAYGRNPKGYETDLDDELDSERGRASSFRMVERFHVILPLYLYDHGGITMSTGSFSCQWDSGQVGWIYATHEKALEEYGGKHGASLSEALEKTEKYLIGEVETYAQYLEGQVYGFVLERIKHCGECGDEQPEDIESVWGFYGDPKESGMADHLGEHAGLLDELS